ncbi:uncharacterized protein LOC122257721 [Penaeus japonicus]|uniref:uncharacterized protein LOC122257721 n=1 Tax=Penaeus japonicus TaxID=27405 RepID=UPI001C70B3A2|nr:uncharacterized protein LOC122257721 [Penaeus japonicus]
MGSLVQCSSVCLSLGHDCVVFTVEPKGSGLVCEVVRDVALKENVLGVHTYCLPAFEMSTTTAVPTTPTTTPDPLIIDGWIKYQEIRYYKPSQTKLNWASSLTACLSQSAGLFVAESFAEYQAVQDSLNTLQIGNKHWIGLKYDETAAEERVAGSLHWEGGATNHFNIQLKNDDTSKNCAFMEKDKTEVEFIPCTDEEHYMCQKVVL